MNKIYVDCGAYDGDTVEQFLNWRGHFDPEGIYSIHAFEPNPIFVEVLNTLVKNRPLEDIHFHPEAVWVEETVLDFAVDASDVPLGSTIMPGKKKIWDNSLKIKVKTIDFSKWLKQFEGREIIVKMDIEGAEFPVLEHLIEQGTIHIPSIFLVEFHPNKVNEYTTTDKIKLIDRLSKLGVKIEEWH